MPFIGRKIQLGVAKESTRGVGVAPSQWIPTASMSFDDVAEKVTSQAAYGGIWINGNEELVTNKHASGDIELELGNETIPLFMLATFGTLSSGSFNSAYKHTFSLQNDNAHDSLTLTTIDDIGQLQFERAMVNTFSLSAELGDLVRAQIGFMSNAHTDTSGHTADFDITDYVFGHQHVAFKVAANTASLDGASEVAIKSLKLDISKNLIVNNVLGTVQPNDILNQGFEITGEITLDYTDRTYRDLMLDGSYQAVRIDIVNEDITIGSTNPSFRIDLSRCAFSGWNKDAPLDDLVTQTLTFKALYDTSNGNLVNDMYVVNETASY